jgi:hypothetical protein
MTTAAQEQVMQELLASLDVALINRHVQRGLVNPGAENAERLEAGVVCIVSVGGGDFANWNGREGELGTMDVMLVGFLQVTAKSPKEAIEQAELALLGEVLTWCGQVHAEPITTVTPGRYRQSQQLEHPLGWLSLELKVSAV